MKNLLLLLSSFLILSFYGFGQQEESTKTPSTEKKQVEKQKVTLKPAKKAKKVKIKAKKKSAVKATIRKKPSAKKEEDQ